MVGIFVAYGVFYLVHWSHTRRVKRLYKQADIRMVGGPCDGVPLDYAAGGHKWPPDSVVVLGLHVYELSGEGEYRFSRTLPPLRDLRWWESRGGVTGVGGP